MPNVFVIFDDIYLISHVFPRSELFKLNYYNQNINLDFNDQNLYLPGPFTFLKKNEWLS